MSNFNLISVFTFEKFIFILFFQFNLFGGTVLRLGTKRHHDKLLAGIDSLEEIGCFGLTELGYGNNAVEMETTATFDPKTGETMNLQNSLYSLNCVSVILGGCFSNLQIEKIYISHFFNKM